MEVIGIQTTDEFEKLTEGEKRKEMVRFLRAFRKAQEECRGVI